MVIRQLDVGYGVSSVASRKRAPVVPNHVLVDRGLAKRVAHYDGLGPTFSAAQP